LDAAQPYVAVIASAFAVTYSIHFIQSVFFGHRHAGLPREPHEPPFWMRFPILFLVLACLIVGIVPAITIGPFLQTAVLSVLGPRTPEYSLAIWHGVNLPLLMSSAAMLRAAVLYAAMEPYLHPCA